MKKIKVLVVEDNRMLRDGLRSIINKQEDMKVVAASAGDRNTLDQIIRLKPLVILVDLGLRNENVLDLVAGVGEAGTTTKIIGMGLIPTQEDIVDFIQAGASGFILKDASVEDFLDTIRSVVTGAKVIPPILAGSLFTHIVDQTFKQGKRNVTSSVRMTVREKEIIAIIAEGLSNKQIATRLNLSTFTVKSHIHNILEKLALHSRLEIAAHSYTSKRK